VQVEEGFPLETCDTLHNNVLYMGTWCVVWACGVGSWCMWDVQVEEGLPLETCDTLRNNVLYVVCGVGMLCGYVVYMGCAGGRRPSVRDV